MSGARTSRARHAIGRSEAQRHDERDLRWFFTRRSRSVPVSKLAERRGDLRARRIEAAVTRVAPSQVALLRATYGPREPSMLRPRCVVGITTRAASVSMTIARLGGVDAYAALARQARVRAATRGGSVLRGLAFVTVRAAVEAEIRGALIAYRHAANVLGAIAARERARVRARGGRPRARRTVPERGR